MRRTFVILALALVLTSCGASQPVTEVTIDASEFAYSIPSLTIQAGQTVRLTLNNIGALEHDFVIEKIEAEVHVVEDSGSDAHQAHASEEGYDFHVSANANDKTTVEFMINEPGTYQFFCSVPGHKDAGMVGELIVEASE